MYSYTFEVEFEDDTVADVIVEADGERAAWTAVVLHHDTWEQGVSPRSIGLTSVKAKQ